MKFTVEDMTHSTTETQICFSSKLPFAEPILLYEYKLYFFIVLIKNIK